MFGQSALSLQDVILVKPERWHDPALDDGRRC